VKIWTKVKGLLFGPLL